MVLGADHRTRDQAARPIHGEVEGLDGLLEHEVGDVLGPVGLPDLGIGGHDHARRPVLTGDPCAVGVGDDPVLVVEDVLAEVPDVAGVVLRIPVERHLVDPPVEIGDELRDQRLDLLAVHVDDLGLGQQHGLDPQRIALVVAQQDGRMKVADREQRVVNGRGHGERRLNGSALWLSGAVGCVGISDAGAASIEPWSAESEPPESLHAAAASAAARQPPSSLRDDRSVRGDACVSRCWPR